FVMLDSEHSIVTSISSDDGSLDVGSPEVIVLGYDRLSMMLEDPYANVEAAMQEPPPPNYVPKPEYPEFMPPKDDVLPAEEQPLPAVVSPTADLPTDYPTDRDDDDEEEESFGDDADDEEEDEGEDEEEDEEHLASAVTPQKMCRSGNVFGGVTS
ncbi:hypothetical protein Tco_1518545, partial [Tanacetum coccineum]